MEAPGKAGERLKMECAGSLGCLRLSFTEDKLEKSREPNSPAFASLCRFLKTDRGNP